ncbi:hypothetical protein LH464_14505 [Neorhizobium sp. T786]|uniref:hypothetical protein n=1 Tax=Pseudorhizobium xiangyangii TaxID=2883104 RepID=UPI001CFFA7E9|nr:hypothetical protein [Neorhizobium xiangyangii]MCB5203687.1 hypothetical protein [Neorhizobium xiangyangii]
MLAGLAPLLASLAAMDANAFIQRARRNAILYAFMLLFVLTAYGTLVAAAAIAIAQRMGAIGALLTVAGGALFLALVMFLIARGMSRAEEKRKREAAASSGSRALMVTAAISALPVLIKSRPIALLALAGGLGFLAMKNIDTLAPGRGRGAGRYPAEPPAQP